MGELISSATQANRTALPVIDRAGMAEMWGDADAALLSRLTETFEREREFRAARLRSALADGDRKAIVLEAHSLKSAAAYLCATRLVDAARSLERDAPGADPRLLDGLVGSVVTACDDASRELRVAIAEQNGPG